MKRKLLGVSLLVALLLGTLTACGGGGTTTEPGGTTASPATGTDGLTASPMASPLASP